MHEDTCERRLNGLSRKNTNISKKKLKRKFLKTSGSTGKSFDKEALNENVTSICLQCKAVEEIPREIVDEFDWLDGGDPLDPPRFSCQNCQSEMVPEYYQSDSGITYDNRHLRSNDYS